MYTYKSLLDEGYVLTRCLKLIDEPVCALPCDRPIELLAPLTCLSLSFLPLTFKTYQIPFPALAPANTCSLALLVQSARAKDPKATVAPIACISLPRQIGHIGETAGVK